MNDNWYVILDLEFDPPVHDIEIINAKITEKAKFWSSRVNDFKRGAEYKRWMQAVPQIRKVMADEDNRIRMAEEAKDLFYTPIDKLVKTIGRGRDISEDEITKIASKLKVNAEIVRNRAKLLGVGISGPKDDTYRAIYDKFYKSKPVGSATFDGLYPLLESFGVDNFYDFLYINTEVKTPSLMPFEVLKERATELKKKTYNKHDAISGSGAKLCGQCEITFEDNENKKTYDNYLVFNRIRNLLREVKDYVDISSEFPPEQYESYALRLAALFKSRQSGEQVLTAFLKVEKIPFVAETLSKSIKICRCSTPNDTSTGATICKNCGEPLTIICPECGIENDNSSKVCKCGFKLENAGHAVALAELADDAITEFDFETAEVRLKESVAYWNGAEIQKTVRERLDKTKEIFLSATEKLEGLVKLKKYYAANREYLKLRELFDNYRDPDYELSANNAVVGAGRFFKEAKFAAENIRDDGERATELCVKAFELCADYPGITELMQKYPPEPVSNVIVETNGVTRANNISWHKSPSGGIIYYVIVRKEGDIPVTPRPEDPENDGEVIARITADNWGDINIKPGAGYYYSIFTERAGVFSNYTTTEFAAANLFEIRNVVSLPANGYAEITWDAIPEEATAIVLKQNIDGEWEKVYEGSNNVYTERNLVNEQTYMFSVKLAYAVNGIKLETRGVTLKIVPVSPPIPVSFVDVKRLNDNHFSAEWQNPENFGADVQLFISDSRPEFKYGETVQRANLTKKLKRIDCISLGLSNAEFELSGEESELFYVSAVVFKSGLYVFGAVVCAGRLDAPVIKNVANVNGNIQIYIEPIDGVDEFQILYGSDQYPIHYDDEDAREKTIPFRQYAHDFSLNIGAAEERSYFISVRAKYISKAGEELYSDASKITFRNEPKKVITYSISKTFKNKLPFKFEVERQLSMPALEVYCASGHTPMFKRGETLLAEIPATTVKGEYDTFIELPKKLPKDTFVKVFFKDEVNNEAFKLKISTKSTFRIN